MTIAQITGDHPLIVPQGSLPDVYFQAIDPDANSAENVNHLILFDF